MKRWLTAIVWVLGLCASAAVWAVPQTAGQFEWRARSVELMRPVEPIQEHTWRHDEGVRAVAFSPDGRSVLTGSYDRTAVLRDAKTGATHHTWRHDGDVWAVAFSPDGRWVLTGSWDRTVVLRDAQTGVTRHTWRHDGGVTAVAFSPDGRSVLTGSSDDTAVLRDAQMGATHHTWRHGNSVFAVAFSPDGRSVLTGSWDKTAVLRDAQTGAARHTWRHDNGVTAVAFSPDGQSVLTGSWDKTAVLRDAQTGAARHTWRHDGGVTAVAFSPDGRSVLTGSDDRTAVLRDAQTGAIRYTWRYDGDVFAVAFSPDGRSVLTGSNDKTAVLRRVLGVTTDFETAVSMALAAAQQRHQRPPVAWEQQRSEIGATQPAPAQLVKDEFETVAQFNARVAAAQRKYEQAVTDWNRRVTELNEVMARHYKTLGPLPLTARAEAMQQAFADFYGAPVLEAVRYDAETGHFFATLKASGNKTFKRTLAIAVPLAEARTVKAALEKGEAVVQLRVTENNAITWEGVTVKAGGKTQLAKFTDADFALPTIAATVDPRNLGQIASPIAPMIAGQVSVTMADDPNLAKLQREVIEKQRAKADAEARAAEEIRLRNQLAELQKTAPASFSDDLPATLSRLTPAQPNPRVHILVVGIQDYKDVPDVPFADRSARAFAELGKKVFGAQEENILLLTDVDATSGSLRGRLRTLINRLTPRDRLIVYYAGHGVPAKDGKSAYLLAQDGGPGSYEEPDLQLDALYAQIEKSRVGQASLFIDACFSGRSGKDTIVFEGVGGITLVPRHGVRPDGRLTVLTAGRSDQFSNQDKAHGHRLFGYHLMKALLEDGPNQTAIQLHTKVSERVLQDSRRIGPEFEQEPELLGNGKVVVGR